MKSTTWPPSIEPLLGGRAELDAAFIGEQHIAAAAMGPVRGPTERNRRLEGAAVA